MNKLKNFLLILLAFISGSFISIFTTLAIAHGGDTNLVHSCVKNTLLPNAANIRIIEANANCAGNETALDWPKTAGTGSNSAFICGLCNVKDILHRTNQADLIGRNFDNALIGQISINNTDIHGSSFVYAVLYGASLNGANGTDTDFTNADLRSSGIENSANLTRAKFINADMSGGSYDGSNFTNADFTNANLSNANFIGSTVTGANFTGVIWENTYCPDNTNSNDNGNTCIGHLTP